MSRCHKDEWWYAERAHYPCIEEGEENLFYSSVFLDVYQLTQIAFSYSGVDQENVYVNGGSQGGGLALVAAALEPRITKAFVIYPFLCDYREAFKLNIFESAYEELAYWFRFRDAAHTKEEKFFKTLDYIDIQYLVPRIKADVLWGMGLKDVSCPPKTQFAVYNNLNCYKELIFYPEYGHESIPEFGDYIHKNLMSSFKNIDM